MELQLVRAQGWRQLRGDLHGKIEYTVIGDTGATGIIGKALYATAKDLGTNPDPSSGGTDSA